MAQVPYIGSTVPAKIVITDGHTDLFRYAVREMGDPLMAWQLAEVNDLPDFWPGAGIALKIPQTAAANGDGVQPA